MSGTGLGNTIYHEALTNRTEANRVGLLLFVVAQVGLLGLIWFVFPRVVPIENPRSFLSGMAYVVGVQVVAFTMSSTYIYLRQRGWVANPRMWWSRVQFGMTKDWPSAPQGYNLDLVRVQVVRNRREGTISGCVAVLGVHLHGWILIDPAEARAFREGQQQAREAYIASMPGPLREAVREMMKTVPLEAQIEVGTIPIVRRQSEEEDEDDDADSKGRTGGGGGVH